MKRSKSLQVIITDQTSEETWANELQNTKSKNKRELNIKAQLQLTGARGVLAVATISRLGLVSRSPICVEAVNRLRLSFVPTLLEFYS